MATATEEVYGHWLSGEVANALAFGVETGMTRLIALTVALCTNNISNMTQV